MATNVYGDPALLEAAQRAGRHRTKHDAVQAALTEYIQRRKRLKVVKAFGTFDFAPGYSHKRLRRAR